MSDKSDTPDEPWSRCGNLACDMRAVCQHPEACVAKTANTALVARVAKAIRQAVRDHEIDDHALYMMGDPTDNSVGQEAANVIAEAVVKELQA